MIIIDNKVAYYYVQMVLSIIDSYRWIFYELSLKV